MSLWRNGPGRALPRPLTLRGWSPPAQLPCLRRGRPGHLDCFSFPSEPPGWHCQPPLWPSPQARLASMVTLGSAVGCLWVTCSGETRLLPPGEWPRYFQGQGRTPGPSSSLTHIPGDGQDSRSKPAGLAGPGSAVDKLGGAGSPLHLPSLGLPSVGRGEHVTTSWGEGRPHTVLALCRHPVSLHETHYGHHALRIHYGWISPKFPPTVCSEAHTHPCYRHAHVMGTQLLSCPLAPVALGTGLIMLITTTTVMIRVNIYEGSISLMGAGFSSRRLACGLCWGRSRALPLSPCWSQRAVGWCQASGSWRGSPGAQETVGIPFSG